MHKSQEELEIVSLVLIINRTVKENGLCWIKKQRRFTTSMQRGKERVTNKERNSQRSRTSIRMKVLIINYIKIIVTNFPLNQLKYQLNF